MRLDFLVSKTKGTIFNIIYFTNKGFSLMLGIVMIIAFVAQYPYVNTRYYSTFAMQIPYTVQYIPMCIAGAYIALKSIEQMAERILTLTGKLPDDMGGAKS